MLLCEYSITQPCHVLYRTTCLWNLPMNVHACAHTTQLLVHTFVHTCKQLCYLYGWMCVRLGWTRGREATQVSRATVHSYGFHPTYTITTASLWLSSICCMVHTSPVFHDDAIATPPHFPFLIGTYLPLLPQGPPSDSHNHPCIYKCAHSHTHTCIQ